MPTSLSSKMPPPGTSLTYDTKTRRRRFLGQLGAGITMSLTCLLPLWLYTPFFFALDDGTYTSPEFSHICDHRNSLSSNTTSSNLINQAVSYLTHIDLPLHRLTLPQARLSSLVWNALIGRGIQACMAYFSYSIVLQGLTRIAETTPVDYTLLTTLGSANGGSSNARSASGSGSGSQIRVSAFHKAYTLLAGLFTLQGWRPKMTMLFLLYSLSLTRCMPSLVEISAGYVHVSEYACDSDRKPASTDPSSPLAATTDARHGAMYVWGFNMIWFITVHVVWSVWVFGMFVVWMDAQHNSRLVRAGRGYDGGLRGAVDLAEAIEREVQEEGEGEGEGEQQEQRQMKRGACTSLERLSGYTGKELGEVLARGKRPLKYYVLQDDETATTRVRLMPAPTVDVVKV